MAITKQKDGSWYGVLYVYHKCESRLLECISHIGASKEEFIEGARNFFNERLESIGIYQETQYIVPEMPKLPERKTNG